jgi:predicted DNA-binding transcriptional regulator YafY
MQVTFDYMTHRGTVEKRTVTVRGVDWTDNPGYNYQPGWFLTGHCHDRDAMRSFALNRIVLPEARRGSYALFRMPWDPSLRSSTAAPASPLVDPVER